MAIAGSVVPIPICELLLVGVETHVLRRYSHCVALFGYRWRWVVLPLGLLIL